MADSNPLGRDMVVIAWDHFAVDAKSAPNVPVRIVSPAEITNVPPPFSRAGIKQGAEAAKLGPDPSVPYFNVRFAMPIPPENDTNLTGVLAGMDPFVWAHNHSPGLEVLPNGDVLAIYFSSQTPRGHSESAPSARFVQARLRHGAEEWDAPELFFDSRDYNDQSALLWRDGEKIWFFGGGREISPWVPFRMAVSTDNGATWRFSVPVLDKPAVDHTPQPIVNAFRGADGSVFMAMDAEENQSFLWRSEDGVHWRDVGGRTGGRHSTIIPLADGRSLLSIGGKNTGIDGYSPQNRSTDWGVTWSKDERSPFPALGGNQRPSLIRLANGNLCFVSDSYHRRKDNSPDGWKHGEGTFVAISKDEGATWHFKRLPVELPHEADRRYGTLGYATVRQAPNGVIHVLATMTHPCLHYEFNEAWVFSDAKEVPLEVSGGRVREFSERYPGGALRAKWSARVTRNGRYLLHGRHTTYYENGRKEHEATYEHGRKTGSETFWNVDGKRVWSWTHRPDKGASTWTHYWPNGKRRMESHWNTRPRARDIERTFVGLEAHGPSRHFDERGKVTKVYRFRNGILDPEQHADAQH